MRKVVFENIGLYPPCCLIHNIQFQHIYGTTKWYCTRCQKTIELPIKQVP
ncbi:MAG: hypothetical protein ACW9W3_05865 [Candidatus Nitrosopumilus sp. bin_68KS]